MHARSNARKSAAIASESTGQGDVVLGVSHDQASVAEPFDCEGSTHACEGACARACQDRKPDEHDVAARRAGVVEKVVEKDVGTRGQEQKVVFRCAKGAEKHAVTAGRCGGREETLQAP